MEEKVWRDVTTRFSSGATRDKRWRKQQLKGVQRMIAEKEREIQDALLQDLRKPPYETWWSEILVVSDSAQKALNELDNWMTPEKAWTQIQAFPCSASIVPEPLGTVLVISPWNFPFMLSLAPVIGAISAGCCVVMKPSEFAPATAQLLSELVPLYLDETAIKVVVGGAPEAEALLNFKWDKIIFTGSSRVGRLVLSAAAKFLTPVILELGGKNPLYVDASVNLQIAAKRIAFGKWATNMGQACASPDYVLAEKHIIPDLVSALKDVITKFYGEDPRLSPDLTRIVNDAHFGRLKSLLEESVKDCQLVHGGQIHEKERFISPTVLVDVQLDSPLMKDEIFGPLLPIVRVQGVEEAIKIINSQPKPLAIYAFTSNKHVKEKLVAQTSSGSLVFNDTVIQCGMLGLPFGGVGDSGTGFYHGKFSFESFSHRKPVLYRHCFADVPARYPPYTDFKENFARRLMGYDFVGGILSLLGLFKKSFYRGPSNVVSETMNGTESPSAAE